MLAMRSRSIPWLWAASIFLVWMLLAGVKNEPLIATQSLPRLIEFGAFKGDQLTLETSWKLLASQWLHAKFWHMILNCLMIGLIGQGLQRIMPPHMIVLLGVGGGAIGQFASAVMYPEAFVSGASQAYLSLAGGALLLLPKNAVSWWTAIVGAVSALIIDLSSDHAALKVGHLVGLLVGLFTAAVILSARSVSPNDR